VTTDTVTRHACPGFEDLPGWLAGQCMPAPVLSPWNSGSGFGPKDKEPLRALEAIP
jgi:hypothetical protein